MPISPVSMVRKEELAPVFEFEYASTMEAMGKNIMDFFKQLKKNKLKMRGPIMTIYLEEPLDGKPTKYLTAVKVNQKTDVTKVYPAHDALKLTVFGPYKQFEEAYAKMGDYIKENGFVVNNPPYEVYVKGPKLGFLMIGLVTEIYFPIEKIA